MSIIIKDLNKVYADGYHALKDLNIEIKGGMFGLLGPNGAGKSTLMRILVALMEPSSGQVTAYGHDLIRDRGKIRQIMGYLPQDFRFFAKYKVAEYLDYAARLSGMNNGAHRRDAIEQMLEQVGLYEVRERYASKLSGGMKRRLGIAQALIHSPKVIIVDEPTTGLDPEERIRFRNLLSDISSKETTIILSTHIVGDISSSCTDMVLLNKGEISFKGSPAQMLESAVGKVWQLEVDPHMYEVINSKYPIVSMVPISENDGTACNRWNIEVVADEIREFKANNVAPNLEHAYVYYMEKNLNLWING
ncbi:MAG: ABC transporter ATP-binding protein [Rikenellaceae bacterium]